MEHIIPFLQNIHLNDNREWFMEHRKEYLYAFDHNAMYIQKLIQLIGKFDADITHLHLSDCSFALPRDSKLKIDNRTYNDFLSGCFARDGKYGGWAGYYYQISPLPSSSGGSLLAVGLYRPNKELMDYFRDEVVTNGEHIDELIRASGFEPYMRNQLRRIPSGYNINTKYRNYLYMRDMMLIKPLNIEWFMAEDWCERTAEAFSRCKPFVDYINSIIERYKRECPLPVGHGLRPIKRLHREQILRDWRSRD